MALGFYQRQAAEALGVDQRTLLNWEKGRRQPPTTAYRAILQFLGYDPRPAATNLGEHLRARRGTLGLSIRAAAAAVGADPTAFGNWERGGIVLHLKHRQRLAEFLGVDPQEIDERMRLLWNEAHAQS